MGKLLIKNGRVMDPASKFDGTADVLLIDGRVAGIGLNLSDSSAVLFDASGMVVAPGFVDGQRLRSAGDRPLRRPSPERRRRYARRLRIGEAWSAGYPLVFGRRDGGARHPARGSHRSPISRGAYLGTELGGHGGL